MLCVGNSTDIRRRRPDALTEEQKTVVKAVLGQHTLMGSD